MAPKNINELNALLQARYAKLSKKMKLIAFFIIDQPQQIALNTLAVISDDIGVFPSTLVRFAKHIGFSGFVQLQELFKVQITQSAVNYRQRITDVKKITEGEISTSCANIFHDITSRNIIATKLLSEQIEVELIEQSVQALCVANEVIVCGMNRALPVAIYFHYMLNNLGIRCRIVDSSSDEATLSHWFNETTVLIAITYNPYSSVTSQAINTAKQSNSTVILLSDTALNPVANLSDYLFAIHEAEVHTFRSLSATLCLAQAICVSIGYNQQGELP
jgi:DNA-binding MurR/RpiR family transcriptional regulator